MVRPGYLLLHWSCKCFSKQSIKSNYKANFGPALRWICLILQHANMGYPKSVQRPNVTFLDFRNIYVMDFCEVLHLFCGFAKIRFQSGWLGWEVPWKLRSDFQPSGKLWLILMRYLFWLSKSRTPSQTKLLLLLLLLKQLWIEGPFIEYDIAVKCYPAYWIVYVGISGCFTSGRLNRLLSKQT